MEAQGVCHCSKSSSWAVAERGTHPHNSGPLESVLYFIKSRPGATYYFPLKIIFISKSMKVTQAD